MSHLCGTLLACLYYLTSKKRSSKDHSIPLSHPDSRVFTTSSLFLSFILPSTCLTQSLFTCTRQDIALLSVRSSNTPSVAGSRFNLHAALNLHSNHYHHLASYIPQKRPVMENMGSYHHQPQWPGWAYQNHTSQYPRYSQQLPSYAAYLPESMELYNAHQGHLLHRHQMSRTTETKPRLSKEEVEVLEAEFQKNHKPNSTVKKALAESMRVDNARINVCPKSKQVFYSTDNIIELVPKPTSTGEEGEKHPGVRGQTKIGQGHGNQRSWCSFRRRSSL